VRDRLTRLPGADIQSELERTLLSFADQYNEFWRMDRSIDWARYFEWQEIVKADASLEDNWHLTALAVSPKYQRRGVGSMLVDVGLELAKRDNISSLLESSRVGEKLYSKKGYKILSQFYLNDGTEMGYAMRFDPDGSSETSNS
jgi:GNAT superfamily N-acetyltransferase